MKYISLFKRVSLVFALTALCRVCAFAVSATPEPIIYTNPDGTQVTLRMFGDEKFAYTTTMDGYLVRSDEAGTMRYLVADAVGRLEMSSQTAADADVRSDAEVSFLSAIDKDAMRSLVLAQAKTAASRASGPDYLPSNEKKGSYPVIGSPKVLIVLAEYQDVRFREGAKEQITDMLNKPGYDYNGATGSALDYFIFSSNGQFTPQFDVYGPVTLENEQAYYGAQKGNDHDIRAPEMVAEACKALDDEINFADYDCDGDGQCDMVYVFYAGQGQADSGIANTIWPHAWYLSGHNCHFWADGRLVNRYATSAEYNTSGTKYPTAIGTFMHEFSHVMGLPDYYDTEYNGSRHPGDWSLMGSGNYLNRQNTPPMYSAYDRAIMGWLKLDELKEPSNVALNPSTSAEGYADAAIISTPNTNEYYVIENRQKTGWDSYIPGEGMLVWHIDYNASVWSNNKVNCDPEHQRVDVVEADPKGGDEYATFPGLSNVRSFTDDTNPAITPWNGTPLGKSLTEIARFNDGVVSMRYNGGVEVDGRLKLNAVSGLTHNTATIGWNQVDGADKYYITLKKGDIVVVPETSIDKTTYVFENLEPKTDYTYTVAYYEGRFMAVESGDFSTKISPLDTRRPVANEATNIGPTSAVVSWEAMEGADYYTIDVFTGEAAGPKTVTATFDDEKLPFGWTTNAEEFNSTSGYYGATAPAIRLSDGLYVQTEQFISDIVEISYVTRRVGTESSTLFVEARKSPAHPWVVVFSGEASRSKARKKLDAAAIGEGMTEVRVRLEASEGVSVIVDDIAVTVGESYDFIPVENNTALRVEKATKYTIKNLDPETDYYYTVTGHNDELSSIASVPVKFTTAEGNVSAIDEVDSDYDCTLTGRTLSVDAAGKSIAVVTPDGRVLVSATGSLNAELPSAGLYIVRIGNTVKKLVCK